MEAVSAKRFTAEVLGYRIAVKPVNVHPITDGGKPRWQYVNHVGKGTYAVYASARTDVMPSPETVDLQFIGNVKHVSNRVWKSFEFPGTVYSDRERLVAAMIREFFRNEATP